MVKKIYYAPIAKVIELMGESLLYAVSGNDENDSTKSRRYDIPNGSIWDDED